MISFDIEALLKGLSKTLPPETVATIKDGFREYCEGHRKKDGTLWAENPREIEEGIALLISRLEGIPKTMRGEFVRELNHGTELGETPQELSKRVSTLFSGTTVNDYNAVIARTVRNYYVNHSNFLATKGLEIYRNKIWLTQRDVDVRPDHAAMDGNVVPIDHKFHLPNGDQLDYPGDPQRRKYRQFYRADVECCSFGSSNCRQMYRGRKDGKDHCVIIGKMSGAINDNLHDAIANHAN